MRGKTYILALIFLSIWIYLTLSFCSAEEGDKPKAVTTISKGMNLPQFTLEAPESKKERKYLGLTESKPFSVAQISAKIIILEIFGIYCPYCRRQAPQLNKVYNLIKQDPNLSSGIKMLGIGAGANKSQVNGWKATLHIPFPLFADKETTIWQKFGKPGIPCTLLVSNDGTVLAAHLGPTEDVEEFFLQIKKIYSEQK